MKIRPVAAELFNADGQTETTLTNRNIDNYTNNDLSVLTINQD